MLQTLVQDFCVDLPAENSAAFAELCMDPLPAEQMGCFYVRWILGFSSDIAGTCVITTDS